MKKSLTYFVLVCVAALFVSCGGRNCENGLSKEMNRKIDSLMNVMTLQEKIGQTVLLTSDWLVTGPVMNDNYLEYIRTGKCGNIFNAFSTEYTRELQRVAVEESRLGIPLLFGLDVIHGYETIFPIPLGESCSWNMEAIEASTAVAAAEAAASGVNWTFAPMVDISVEPRWGRVCEGAGEDPYLGARVAEARVHGFQGASLDDSLTVLSCIKHYAGYGAPQGGRDYNTVDMSERYIREFYLPTYEAGVKAGALSIMTSFNELDGVPATDNRHLLQDILRDEWGFNGFVVTDYTAINETINHGYAVDGFDAAEKAFNAGVDMDMQGELFANCLETLVDEGKVDLNALDNAVRRILEVKARLGLFDDPYKYCNAAREKRVVFSKENLSTALSVAEESLVLLKNDGALPLKKGERVVVVGELAASGGDMLGSWTAVGDRTATPSILEAIKTYNGSGNVVYVEGCKVSGDDRRGFLKALAAVVTADKVVMVLGETADMCGEAASRTSIKIPGVQTELLKLIAATGKPVVVVLMNGRPLDLSEESPLASAILEAWYPGSMGAQAVTNVLFGERCPSGKLTMSFPRNIGQVPVFYYSKNTGRPVELPDPKYKSKYIDCENTPLYPFGYGLSYTNFTYSDLTLSSDSFSSGGEVIVTVSVRNDGKVAGDEVVQLYIRDLVGSVTRPVKQLKGFEKVHLEAGESRTVSFRITEEMLAFYRQDMTYGAEAGDFQVFVGGSSADETLLKTSFTFAE